MKRAALLTLLSAWAAAVIGPPLLADTLPHIPPETAGITAYREAQRLIYSEQGETPEIERLIERASDRFQDQDTNSLRHYWLARAQLLSATHYNQVERTEAAERAIRRGFDHIEASLDLAGVYSEGLRVLGDLHSQMMFARGLVYMLRHGDEARDSVLRALELAPRSVKARISAAGYYLNAPGFAGGDAARAREILLGALELDPENRNDRFLILGWLAVASSELGNEADAERYYHRARSIYAESSWLAEIGREIGVR